MDIAGRFHGLGRQQYERDFATAGSSCDFAAAIAAFGPAVPEAVDTPSTILTRAYKVIE